MKCDICDRKFVPSALTIFAVSEYGLYDWGSPRPEVSYTLCPKCLHQMNMNLAAASDNTFEEARTEGYWNQADEEEIEQREENEMSLYEYEEGKGIAVKDPPFYALIQAAMRKADTCNLELLKECWPEIWRELRLRYNASGGKLQSELKGDEQTK